MYLTDRFKVCRSVWRGAGQHAPYPALTPSPPPSGTAPTPNRAPPVCRSVLAFLQPPLALPRPSQCTCRPMLQVLPYTQTSPEQAWEPEDVRTRG
ncbi:hypothetical protein O3P69_001246 [Scylla paramamosain]|uniref:Uncharacterized protein n=1 Tax=Scylla paramamosain TaxID=85552 RepID=A0AAW0UQ66_SCYPA